MARADKALCVAKGAGRDRVMGWSAGLRETLPRRRLKSQERAPHGPLGATVAAIVSRPISDVAEIVAKSCHYRANR